MITLGSKVKDTVHGMVGVATARCEYLNGCVSIKVEVTDKEKRSLREYWIDEVQLKAVVVRKRTAKVAAKKTGMSRTYGVHPTPPSRNP